MRSTTFLLITLIMICWNPTFAIKLSADEPPKTDKEEFYGLKFDGRDSYVTLPHVNFSDWKGFTVEAWVKDWNGRICCQGKQGDPENSLWISIRADRHSTGWESDNGINYSNPVNPNSVAGWDHVALVYDGVNQSIYLNGKLVHQKAAPKPGPFHPERKLFLGAQQSWKETQTKPAGLFGSGIMRLFRVSKVPRYDKEFEPADNFETDDNTVVLFDFAKPDQTSLKDLSHNKNDGTIHHAKWVMERKN